MEFLQTVLKRDERAGIYFICVKTEYPHPTQQNQSQKDRSGLIPVVLVHREDKRCADPACAHESENGRLTDIDVKAVEDGGAERRSDLRENAVEDGWNRVDTHGEECPVRAEINGLQTFGEALCEKSDAADC